MASPIIQHLRSYTAGKIPTSAQCPEGLLFMNITDKQIGSTNNGGVYSLLANYFTRTSTSLSTTKTFTATASQTSFAAKVRYTGSAHVYQNGLRITTFTVDSSGNVVLASGAAAGDTLVVVILQRNFFYKHQEYTTSAAGTQSFTMTGGYRTGTVQAFIDGLKVARGSITASDTTTVSVTAAASGQSVVLTTMNGS